MVEKRSTNEESIQRVDKETQTDDDKENLAPVDRGDVRSGTSGVSMTSGVLRERNQSAPPGEETPPIDIETLTSEI